MQKLNLMMVQQNCFFHYFSTINLKVKICSPVVPSSRDCFISRQFWIMGENRKRAMQSYFSLPFLLPKFPKFDLHKMSRLIIKRRCTDDGRLFWKHINWKTVPLGIFNRKYPSSTVLFCCGVGGSEELKLEEAFKCGCLPLNNHQTKYPPTSPK